MKFSPVFYIKSNIFLKRLKKQQKDTDTHMKMKKFCKVKIKAFPPQNMLITLLEVFTSRVVISRELFHCSMKEIKTGLRKQGLIDVRRVSIEKLGELIQTTMYVLICLQF